MTNSITAYHGSPDIWNILRCDAILSPYEKQLRWEFFKPKYDDLTKQLADVAREKNIAREENIPNNLVLNDEALADLVAMRMGNLPETMEYRELIRNLFVHLTAYKDIARNYLGTENDKNLRGVIEVEIPRNLVRQSYHLFQGGLGLIQVPREISLDYARRIFVSTGEQQKDILIACGVFGRSNLEVLVL